MADKSYDIIKKNRWSSCIGNSFSSLIRKFFRDKCIFLIVVLFVLTIFLNVFAYILNNPILNCACFFSEGVVSIIVLYKILWIVGKKICLQFSKHDVFAILLAVLVSFCIYVFIVNTRTTVYVWDNTTYYNSIHNLCELYKMNNISGLSEWFYSGMMYDYGSFLTIFIYPFFIFTNDSIQAFILSYYFACVIPVMLSIYMISIHIKDRFFKSINGQLYKYLIGVSLSGFPLLHTASISGQPDIFGLVFAAIIVLLTLSYDFTYRDYSRWVIIFFSTIALVLTRRWYVFFVIGYYISYFAVLVIMQIISKNKQKIKKMILNILVFGVSSVVLGLIVLYKMLFMILTNNFSNSYLSWNKGGLPYELINQIGMIGIILAALVIFGWFLGVKKAESRLISLIMIFTFILILFVFTRVQNMGCHHSLLLFLPYWYGLLYLLLYMQRFRTVFLKSVPAFILIITMIFCSCFKTRSQVSNLLFSNLNIYPQQRCDIIGLDKVTNYLNRIIKSDDRVMVLSASDNYDSSVFSNYPNVSDNKFINTNNYYASSGGFPDDFFTSTYVMLISPLQEREQVKEEKVLSEIVNAFKNEKIISIKFEMLRSINITNGIDAYIYRRIKPVDNDEVDVFLDLFSSYCQQYPDLFLKRLNSYKNLS